MLPPHRLKARSRYKLTRYQLSEQFHIHLSEIWNWWRWKNVVSLHYFHRTHEKNGAVLNSLFHLSLYLQFRLNCRCVLVHCNWLFSMSRLRLGLGRVCCTASLSAKISSPKAVARSCLKLCAESGWVKAVWLRQKTCEPVIRLTPAQQVCLLNNSMRLSTQSQVRWRGTEGWGTTTQWDNEIIKRFTHGRFFSSASGSL